MSMLDLRRTDLRSNVLANPFWLTSGWITPDADDAQAVLFSFPIASKYSYFMVHEVGVQTITAFAGGTVAFTLGIGTIPLEVSTTGATVSVVDADEYMATLAVAGMGSTGLVFADTSGDFLTAKAAGTSDVNMITCADTTVPVIYGALTSDAAITAGKARVLVLGSFIPV